MRMSCGTRTRAVLASVGALGLALAAASPAMAASGTPTTPTELFSSDEACATAAGSPDYVSAKLGLGIEAVPGDTDAADNSQLTLRYQVWPVADPAQTTTLSRSPVPIGDEAGVTVPAGDLADGQTYAWQAQTVTGSDASDWSAPCYVTVDNTNPSPTPVITSSNYPENQSDQGGMPVRFTLGANGVSDVEGFEFDWQQDLPVPVTAIGDHGIPQPTDPYDDTAHFVRADSLGGSATVNLVPPAGFGPMTLHVVSLDRAGNPSAQADYEFILESTAPTITPTVASPQFDETDTLKLKPNPALESAGPVLSYSVKTIGGQNDKTITVDAAADGTAEVTLPLDGNNGEYVDVTSTSADGWVSDEASWYTWVDTTPTVSSDDYPENGSSGGAGVSGTFAFAPKVKHVVSYTYSFDWGQTSVTVDASADGTARINWTPTDSGYYDLDVYATTSDGIQLAPYDYYFNVN